MPAQRIDPNGRRRLGRVAVVTETDERILRQGQAAGSLTAGTGLYGFVIFSNDDAGGREIDITSLYVWLAAAGSCFVGTLQGVSGATFARQATPAWFNQVPPPVSVWTLSSATDPSLLLSHFGTSNGGQVVTPTGVIFRIPTGYALYVRADTQAVQIKATIHFYLR